MNDLQRATVDETGIEIDYPAGKAVWVPRSHLPTGFRRWPNGMGQIEQQPELSMLPANLGVGELRYSTAV